MNKWNELVRFGKNHHIGDYQDSNKARELIEVKSQRGHLPGKLGWTAAQVAREPELLNDVVYQRVK